MNAIPSTVMTALKAGGLNIQWGWYDYPKRAAERAQHLADAPAMWTLGARHIRIPCSMETFEQGTTGTVIASRYNEFVAFIKALKALGFVSIVDIHNTGIGSPDWTDDYMGNLRNAAIADRFLRLEVDLITRLGKEDSIRDWYIFQPANEPIFGGGAQGDKSIWFNFQNKLIPALRAAAPDAILFIMANDWQGIDATIYDLSKNMAFADARTIIDCHFYEPVEGFTHCDSTSCANAQYPGNLKTWRGNLLWNKAKLQELIAPIAAFRDSKGVPFIHFSEIGMNHKFVAEDVRARYMGDLIAVLRGLGLGYSVYTWGNDEFSIQGQTKVQAVLFPGNVQPTPPPEPIPDPTPVPDPTPTPDPEPPPVDPSVEIAALKQRVAALEAWKVDFLRRLGDIASMTVEG